MEKKGINEHREHQEKISSSIGAEPYWNLIHHEISIKEAMTIKEVRLPLTRSGKNLRIQKEGQHAGMLLNLSQRL